MASKKMSRGLTCCTSKVIFFLGCRKTRRSARGCSPLAVCRNSVTRSTPWASRLRISSRAAGETPSRSSPKGSAASDGQSNVTRCAPAASISTRCAARRCSRRETATRSAPGWLALTSTSRSSLKATTPSPLAMVMVPPWGVTVGIARAPTPWMRSSSESPAAGGTKRLLTPRPMCSVLTVARHSSFASFLQIAASVRSAGSPLGSVACTYTRPATPSTRSPPSGKTLTSTEGVSSGTVRVACCLLAPSTTATVTVAVRYSSFFFGAVFGR
mmetsp:Transcript_41287/g.129326  ORF Transcript_41287/g.129326 Transcript_41287/m.129326 type:complete len:271 (+) Transcript_41287:3718-4530(+)